MNPEPDISIWHYLDLAKYIGLLSRGLFFARPSALRVTDSWEGSCGELDFTESLNETVHATTDGVEKWQEALRVRHLKQDTLGISCWHESQTESVALWKLYSPLGLGVAVKSTPAKLRASLTVRSVEVRGIDYGGHRSRRLGEDPIVLLSTKRPEFKHEAEVRFFVSLTADECTVLNSFYSKVEKHRAVRRIKPGNRKPLIETWPSFSMEDATCIRRGAPAGMHIPTDAAMLIDRVYLAPTCAYSTRRAVVDVTERFGLSKELIAETELDLAPFDRVEFY